MSIPCREVITYKRAYFPLTERPFDMFLEQNKHIVLRIFRFPNFDGYQGYWLLKDEKLYLTKIESADYNLRKLFGSPKRVFADWYTGILQFGIGEHHEDGWWGYYDNYWHFTIKNGNVIAKKVLQELESNES